MESTFDIEATRIPESKQEQRIDMFMKKIMLQHIYPNKELNEWIPQVHQLVEKPLGEQKVNKNNKEQIEQIQDRSFVPHVRAES